MIENKVNGFLMLALLGATMMVTAASGDEMLGRLREVYTRTAATIDAEHAAATRERPARYRSALNTALLDFQKQGDLKGVLAVRDERKRFDHEGTVPAEPSPDTLHAVAKLQAEWHRQNEQETFTRNQNIVDLVDKYTARLDALKRERTIEGRFDDAIAVQKEIDRVRQSPAVTAAQFALALHDRETNVPDPTEHPAASPSPEPSPRQPPDAAQQASACPRCEGTGEIMDDCRACKGTGHCSSCKGKGRRPSGFRGSNALVGCISCKTTGQCRQCDGTGQQKRACPACRGTGKAP